MSIDAIILSGGRAARLGGVDKAELCIDGVALLDRTVDAVARCRRVVVAGPRADAAGRATAVREDPPHSGPAAGVVAALAVLPAPDPGDRVLLLSCDLVEPSAVIDALAGAVGASVVLRDRGRPQWLTGIHDAIALRRAAGSLPEAGAGASMRSLLAPLEPVALDVADGLAADVDTWDDAARARARRPAPATPPVPTPEEAR